MTHEQILGCSADQLEKMTDEEILKWYEPYLKITRPELAEKPVSNILRSVSHKQSIKNKANNILQQLGIDLKV